MENSIVGSARFIVVHVSVSDAHHVKIADIALKIYETIPRLVNVTSLRWNSSWLCGNQGFSVCWLSSKTFSWIASAWEVWLCFDLNWQVSLLIQHCSFIPEPRTCKIFTFMGSEHVAKTTHSESFSAVSTFEIIWSGGIFTRGSQLVDQASCRHFNSVIML